MYPFRNASIQICIHLEMYPFGNVSIRNVSIRNVSNQKCIHLITIVIFRAICHPLTRRQAYYKYIVIVVILSLSIEFPRFFEMKLNSDKSQYWTTDLMENPRYVQFSSYWNDITATGLVPLLLLCYMNLRIFFKVQVRNFYFLSNCQKSLLFPFFTHWSV